MLLFDQSKIEEQTAFRSFFIVLQKYRESFERKRWEVLQVFRLLPVFYFGKLLCVSRCTVGFKRGCFKCRSIQQWVSTEHFTRPGTSATTPDRPKLTKRI